MSMEELTPEDIQQIARSDRARTALACGEIAGLLMRLAKLVTPDEIHRLLKEEDSTLTPQHRALLSVALATYEYLEHHTELIIVGKPMSGMPWISCPTCGWVSYNINDVQSLYCGHCHKFHFI